MKGGLDEIGKFDEAAERAKLQDSFMRSCAVEGAKLIIDQQDPKSEIFSASVPASSPYFKACVKTRTDDAIEDTEAGDAAGIAAATARRPSQ